MDVEVDDRHALQTVDGLGMQGTYSDAVEQAEAAGNARQGMVSGRTHRGEDGLRGIAHHRINAGDHGAGGVTCRLGALGAHDGVGVDLDQFAGRRPDTEDRLDILLRVHAHELLEGGGGRHDGNQVSNGRVVERGQHRAEPVGSLWMVIAGIVGQE